MPVVDKIAMALQRLAPAELKALQSGVKTEAGASVYKKVLSTVLRQTAVQTGAKLPTPAISNQK